MRLVFCPHGQSDKGFKAPLLAPYAAQDIVLVYGPLLIQMLKELHIWPRIQQHLVVGNYRLQFYQKYRAFYDAILEREAPIDRKKKTLLYAPTWKDADEASSFFQQAAKVIRELPQDWNLIFKVHPLLEQRDPAHFYRIAAQAEQKENVFFIDECPLIYPFLERADLYLGDASSVGYDFLYFERPLYFFPTDTPGRIRRCGRVIDPNQNLYLQLERENIWMREQNQLYRFAFGDPISREQCAHFFKTRTATCS
jgi:CDP-glycerol glycerophosphotransferase (TagB/SpsB family)